MRFTSLKSALVASVVSASLGACVTPPLLDLGGDAGQGLDAGAVESDSSIPGDAQGNAVHGCTPGAWSSSATGWIVFDSDVDGMVRHVFAVRPGDCAFLQLTFGEAADQEPAVSPDGSTLVFSSSRSADGSFQLFALDLASHALTQLTTVTGGAGQPAFSPDGAMLAYHSGYSVYRMAADGSGGPAVLVSSAGSAEGTYEHPAFLPDGNRIVVDRQNEIDSFDLQGQGEQSLVENYTEDELYPAVSPDGTLLAFVSPCNALTNVMIASLAAPRAPPCSARIWTPSILEGITHPTWGPSAWIAFARLAGDHLDRVAISDESQQIYDLAVGQGDQLHPVWAPGSFNPN
ncbi:MAG TPA: hypothetical protein VHS09_12460 [Polyangiaceae bacterium]|nr:hypothetical protein [Polyangiaceae bacterium]